MNKAQLDSLAEMVRTTPPIADQAILWAVRHHLALFLYGIESAETCIEELLKACNTQREDGIVQRIGLEALLENRDGRIVRLGNYAENTFIRNEGKRETSEI